MKKPRVVIYFVLVILFTLFNFYYRPVTKNEFITDDYRKSSAYINDLYKSTEYFKERLLTKEEYLVYDQMVNDVKTGVITSQITCGSPDECSHSYLNTYYALYLDHPEFLAFQGASASIQGNILSIRYHSIGVLKTYFGTRRIEREMDIIRKETKGMSEKEKIIYVYNYVAGHDYDKLFTYVDSNQSAYSFFTKGTSVCAGFAKASQLIFQNIGISSYLVMSTEHMWNYVEYEGKYYVFDATVGASYNNKKSQYFYEGLGRTTIDTNIGLFSDSYPAIEEKPLKEIFGL